MGKGRAPCCDKSKVKRGPWSPAEDLRLIAFIQKHGHENWRALPKQAGLLRCGKSCRLRWINYLRPDVKRGNFSREEEDTIIKLHQTMGNKWSKIASYLPGRTDNEIKNIWNTHLKKRSIMIKNSNHHIEDESKELSPTSSSSSSTSTIVSGGEKGGEIELEDHQWNQPMKELSSCSISSNNSNVSDQVDISKEGDEHQIGSIFSDYVEAYDVQNAGLMEEVNKPDNIQDYNSVEIPFESDYDFWNMLDCLSSFQSNASNEEQLQNPKESHSSSFEGSNNGEDENKRWLRYLENELGLEDSQENIW